MPTTTPRLRALVRPACPCSWALPPPGHSRQEVQCGVFEGLGLSAFTAMRRDAQLHPDYRSRSVYRYSGPDGREDRRFGARLKAGARSTEGTEQGIACLTRIDELVEAQPPGGAVGGVQLCLV